MLFGGVIYAFVVLHSAFFLSSEDKTQHIKNSTVHIFFSCICIRCSSYYDPKHFFSYIMCALCLLQWVSCLSHSLLLRLFIYFIISRIWLAFHSCSVCDCYKIVHLDLHVHTIYCVFRFSKFPIVHAAHIPLNEQQHIFKNYVIDMLHMGLFLGCTYVFIVQFWLNPVIYVNVLLPLVIAGEPVVLMCTHTHAHAGFL